MKNSFNKNKKNVTSSNPQKTTPAAHKLPASKETMSPEMIAFFANATPVIKEPNNLYGGRIKTLKGAK